MAFEGPGTITVVCDECGETIEAEAQEYCGDPITWGVDDSAIEEAGWIIDENCHYCRECAEQLGLTE